ncbi:hypothetical protein [Rubritalea sp.]|uniref:hypothetical protein n=1 Tax=Rubritalea sp. TaxID=2109375 RepID=UPI0032428AD7
MASFIFSITIWNSQSSSNLKTSSSRKVAEVNDSIDFSLKLPSFDGSRLHKGINDLTVASSGKVNKTSKRITRVTQKLHFLTTQFSELIPVTSEPSAPQGALPHKPSQAS